MRKLFKTSQRRTEFRNLYIVKIRDIYWIKDSNSSSYVSWSLNKPDAHTMQVLSRGIGWQYETPFSSQDFYYYKGKRNEIEA